MFWQTGILKSFDEGASWSDYVTVASKLADEKSIIRLPSGRFLAMIRDLQTPYLYKCYSEDNGNAWSAISNSGIIGQCPCLFLTKKGQLLCSYRDTKPGHKGLGLSYSLNEGEDWQEWGHLYSSGEDEWDHSYPSMAYLDSGNIFCVYYTNFTNGNSDIEGVEIAID